MKRLSLVVASTLLFGLRASAAPVPLADIPPPAPVCGPGDPKECHAAVATRDTPAPPNTVYHTPPPVCESRDPKECGGVVAARNLEPEPANDPSYHLAARDAAAYLPPPPPICEPDDPKECHDAVAARNPEPQPVNDPSHYLAARSAFAAPDNPVTPPNLPPICGSDDPKECHGVVAARNPEPEPEPINSPDRRPHHRCTANNCPEDVEAIAVRDREPKPEPIVSPDGGPGHRCTADHCPDDVETIAARDPERASVFQSHPDPYSQCSSEHPEKCGSEVVTARSPQREPGTPGGPPRHRCPKGVRNCHSDDETIAARNPEPEPINSPEHRPHHRCTANNCPSDVETIAARNPEPKSIKEHRDEGVAARSPEPEPKKYRWCFDPDNCPPEVEAIAARDPEPIFDPHTRPEARCSREHPDGCSSEVVTARSPQKEPNPEPRPIEVEAIAARDPEPEPKVHRWCTENYCPPGHGGDVAARSPEPEPKKHGQCSDPDICGGGGGVAARNPEPEKDHLPGPVCSPETPWGC